MLKENILAMSLTAAREKRGWSIYQASNRMIGVFPNTLRSLEGLNPDRNPAGLDCKLRTVLEIIRVYWPHVTLEHFTECDQLLRLVPKNAKADRKLKGFLKATG
jgi:hypothetical protein